MRTRLSPGAMPTLTAAGIMLALLIVGGFRYDHFATPSNLSNLLADGAYIGIAAVGATLVILSGGIDLSVASLVAFAGVLAAHLIANGCHPLPAFIVCIGSGAIAGALMGALIEFFALPAFMVTLAGMFALRASAFLVLEQSTGVSHPFLKWATRSAILDLGAGASLPLRSLVLLAVVVVGSLLARRTPFGKHLHAIGGSERSSRSMGVPIAQTRVAVYALSGTLSSLAGCVFMLQKQAANPAAVPGLELTVIAAVVIGGTLLSGGVGSIPGTLVGVLILGLIRMMIDFEGNLNAAWTSVATAGLLLFFVALQNALTWFGRVGVRP